ncbi:metal-dependent hydrolase [Ammoniphilus sp. CFH 90114]|uniref:metal-dependent hydrolase n=1 Tax=Ammoniphilus sp. CFH 90114 TaxID=2493665 RepID=UPI00100EAB2E|nr:metal-dependent hydrolase [Ammoniphilus sp. CFH 90114]RXT04107.1 metal-dependent hydrolase [Ammoniphilus sp. CFH 90114]
MDTITHTLFGLTIYKAINKEEMNKPMKHSLLFTAVIGSQIPDIDVVSKWWDQQGLYLMWHRGITHSVFLVPVWALLLTAVCYLIWKVKDKRIFYTGLLAVFIHNTSDIFNAWGTGYLEPFSNVRLTFGTIPIIDFVVWTIILFGFILSRLRKYPTHQIFKGVGLLIAVHFLLQSAQGFYIYQNVKDQYEQVALSADFVPWNFKVIGKRDQQVEILGATSWGTPKMEIQLQTAEETNLDYLFEENTRARTLYQWAPFVVVVKEQGRLGIYDPRFYRNGQSFLFEYIETH